MMMRSVNVWIKKEIKVKDMRKYYINERYADSHSGNAIASTYNTDGLDAVYISLEDIINTLQAEANEIAGILMTNELSPSPETETDRRYSIGRWDKINELINMLKGNGN